MDNDIFKVLLDNLSDGVYFVDLDRKIIYWNLAAERLTGFKSSEVVGTNCQDNILMHINEDGDNVCLCACPVSAAINGGKQIEMDLYLHHKDGYRLPVSVKVAPIQDNDGKIIGAVEIFSDNSTKESLLERIEELKKEAYNDFITGLANRYYTEICLKERYDEMDRYGWPFGLIFMDVDNFKEINDSFGHNIGDRILKTVSQALLKNSRSFDLLGRWGGDEFIAVVLNVDQEKLTTIAERYRMLVAQSKIDVDSQAVGVTVSIGASLAKPGESVDALLEKVDQLMYRSKSDGGNQVTYRF